MRSVPGPRGMGSIGDQVDRLRVVFAQGEVADLGFERWPGLEAEPADFKDLVVRKLMVLFRSCEGRLGRQMPALVHDRAGYALARAASEAGIHLGRLVAGSEGTLAVILQAVLRTVPVPAGAGVVLLPFVGLSDAAGIVPELIDPRLRPVLVRPVRPAVAQPGTRRGPLVPRLDPRGGRGHPDG